MAAGRGDQKRYEAAARVEDGMADALWKHAWKTMDPSVSLHGKPLPPTPPGAREAAGDLEKLYVKANCVKFLDELRQPVDKDDNDFGYRLAMEALGESYQGPQLALIAPLFQCWFNGDELWWDGKIDLGVEGHVPVRRRNPQEGELTVAEVRGLGRRAARADVPAGHAYREACRAHSVPRGSWEDFAAAYDDELASMDDTSQNPGEKRWLVIMINTDPSDTHAVELRGLGETDFDDALSRAIELANPDERDSIMYTTIEAKDAGAARLLGGKPMARQWKLYKGMGPHITNPHRWPGSEVQSLLFDVNHFTEHQAKAWAKDNGFHYGKVDTTSHYHRLRQEAPTGGPCRTIDMTDGVKAIVCSTGHGRPPGVPNSGKGR